MTNGVGVATTINDIALVYIYKIRVEKQNKSYNFNFQIEIKNIITVVFKSGTIRMKECERRLCAERFRSRAVQSIAIISRLTSTAK